MLMSGTCEALDGREQAQEFFGFAAGGEGEHDVAANDHAEVAMDGVDRVHEQGGSSNRTQGGGDFAGDDAALAHAGDDDAALAGEHEIDGALEGRGHGAADAIRQSAQGLRLNADDVLAGAVHVERRWYQSARERRHSSRRSEVIVDHAKSFAQSLSLDDAIPGTALPVVFFLLGTQPGWNGKEQPAAQGFAVGLVEAAQFQKLLVGLVVVPQVHAGGREVRAQLGEMLGGETVGCMGIVPGVDDLGEVDHRVSCHGKGQLRLLGVNAVNARQD